MKEVREGDNLTDLALIIVECMQSEKITKQKIEVDRTTQKAG